LGPQIAQRVDSHVKFTYHLPNFNIHYLNPVLDFERETIYYYTPNSPLEDYSGMMLEEGDEIGYEEDMYDVGDPQEGARCFSRV